MRRLRIILGLPILVAVALTASWSLGADDPPKKDPEKGAMHKLPTHYSKLGLTDAQKKKIYAIEDEIDPKIAKLKKEIEDLTQEKHTKVHDVLTDEQKKRLVELRNAADGPEKPKDTKPADDKKP
jgi:Spy/CpxP family protein refolding chaperone